MQTKLKLVFVGFCWPEPLDEVANYPECTSRLMSVIITPTVRLVRNIMLQQLIAASDRVTWPSRSIKESPLVATLRSSRNHADVRLMCCRLWLHIQRTDITVTSVASSRSWQKKKKANKHIPQQYWALNCSTFLMFINLISHFLPSEDQSCGSPGKVRRELSPERVQLKGQWADAAPGPKREQWLDEAPPHHCRNNDVSALCERNKTDVLSVLLSYLLTLIIVGLHCPVYSR